MPFRRLWRHVGRPDLSLVVAHATDRPDFVRMRHTCHMATRPAPQDPNASLWVSGNPRFGTVRKVVIDGAYAATLDDLNSDYREVTMTVLERNASDWGYIAAIDDAGYPGVHETTSYGWSNGYAVIVGREHPGAVISVWLHEERHVVEADSEGWWLFVRESWPPPAGASSPEPYLRWSAEEDPA